MISNILSIVANISAHKGIIAPSTTTVIEISMVNATIPSIIFHTGIYRRRTAVTTITITAAVTFNDDCD